MKKAILILVLLVCLVGCYHTDYKSTTIKYDELIKMFEEKKTFVVYASNETCASCVDYRANVDDFCQDNEVTIYCYYCVDFESEEVKDLKYNYFYRLDETPTTYVVVDGQVTNYYVGTLSKELLLKIFKEYKLL